MLNRSLSLAAGAALLSWGLTACATARGPATSDDRACGVPSDAATVSSAHGEAASAASASGPEASTMQGRRSAGVATPIGVNRSQSGDNTTLGTTYDGSGTNSAGAPANVMCLWGATASATAASGGEDSVTKTFAEELAGIRTRLLTTADPAERARLDAEASAIRATIADLAKARIAVAATAAAAPQPSLPNLTTVVFTNASGSAAGTDKPAVDPKNAEAIATGLPALVKEARAK